MNALSLKKAAQKQHRLLAIKHRLLAVKHRLLAVTVLLLGLLALCTTSCACNACNARQATPTPSATVPPPTSTPSPTASPTPTATPPPTATPTHTPTPTPLAGAIVLTDGTALRPGATTWWYPRHTLTAGTTLDIQGYDPDFPDWIYVSRVNSETLTGWTEIKNLDLHRDLQDLPLVTPIPTLTPTPATDAITPTDGTPLPTLPPSAPPTISAPPEDCEGGPLTLQAWHGEKYHVEDGWVVKICAEAKGGDCMYTYFWENEIKAGPVGKGPTCFEVKVGTFAETVVGTVSVTSAGQTARHGLYITRPPQD